MMAAIPFHYFLRAVLLIVAADLVSGKPPHIIFILIDDLGWNDVSFHGSKQIPTPNIDALAYDGLILDNYYVQPICTPSRASLMTGKYPIRLGLQHDVIYAEQPYGLAPEERILPQFLRDLGYATHGVGKWHLGFFHESYLPTKRGFDSFFGYWTGKEDFYSHFEEGEGTHGLDLHDDNDNARNYTGIYGTDLFTSKAKTIIQNHDASKPLFLYVAHQAVHAGNSYTPLQAPLDSVNKFKHIKDEDRRKFAGMVSRLDDTVGELVATLNDAGLLQDSLLVLSTDNGAAVRGIDQSCGSSYPLRGAKYGLWEGGVRAVGLLWSTMLGSTRRSTSRALVHISDWLPTIYAAAGGDVSKLQGIDGYNLWPNFSSGEPSPRTTILHNIDPEWKVEAVRSGRYKLLRGSVFDGKFDCWFDKEGRPENDHHIDTAIDIATQEEVYARIANESEVINVLSNLNGDDHFLEAVVGESNSKRCCQESNYCTIGDVCEEVSKLHPKSRFSPIVINCGKKVNDTCRPREKACLFDIVDDPCEYNNLASTQPQVLKELEGLLNKYRSEAVSLRNKPLDPSANPKFHGYAWVPWVKKL